MNRLVRSGALQRFGQVRRYESQKSSAGGGGKGFAFVTLAAAGGAAYYFANNGAAGKPEPTNPRITNRFSEENRKDWEKYLPISEKHQSML